MLGINKVFLLGNLTRDPELRFTSSGQAVCNFSVAVNKRVKKDDVWTNDVDYFDIVVWGKQGENCSEYLSKGRGVFVEGRLQNDTWETEDGQKRSKIRVVAVSVHFLPKSTSVAESGGEFPPQDIGSDSPFN